MCLVIGCSDIRAVLFSFSGVALIYTKSSFGMPGRQVGIWIDLTRVLAIFLDNFGSFIELVAYWWNLFSFNQDVGPCFVRSCGCFC